jgi:hypothetical protein
LARDDGSAQAPTLSRTALRLSAASIRAVEIVSAGCSAKKADEAAEEVAEQFTGAGALAPWPLTTTAGRHLPELPMPV